MISVSFIIPTYNYRDYIDNALASLLCVKEGNDEIIVVDDGSTDDTASRLETYIENNMIRYHYQKNAGVSAARNTGARYAGCEYLYFLDADDRVIKEGFDQLRQCAESEPDKVMIFGGHISIERSRRRVHKQLSLNGAPQAYFRDYAIRRRFSIANGGCVLIRRETALAYPYPESLKVSEDFVVYARIFANEAVASIEEPVVEIYKHADSLRNQATDYQDVVRKLPDMVFDKKFLPVSLLSCKRQFFCNRLLSLFRIQFLANDYETARKTYVKAIQCWPANVFKFSYLRKFFRALFK